MYSLFTPLLTIIKKILIHTESSTVSVELDHHYELRSYKFKSYLPKLIHLRQGYIKEYGTSTNQN